MQKHRRKRAWWQNGSTSCYVRSSSLSCDVGHVSGVSFAWIRRDSSLRPLHLSLLFPAGARAGLSSPSRTSETFASGRWQAHEVAANAPARAAAHEAAMRVVDVDPHASSRRSRCQAEDRDSKGEKVSMKEACRSAVRRPGPDGVRDRVHQGGPFRSGRAGWKISIRNPG